MQTIHLTTKGSIRTVFFLFFKNRNGGEDIDK
nr:MAG TPA: hypothetical protein [Caudoviricetes sp.]